MLNPKQLQSPFQATAATTSLFILSFNPQELLISFIETGPLRPQRRAIWASKPKSVKQLILLVGFVTGNNLLTKNAHTLKNVRKE